MASTPNTNRKIAAGVAAVVLTLAAASAAVALNVGASVDSPAGKLATTQPADSGSGTSGATPSTIYVDLAVPATEAPTSAAPRGAAPAGIQPSTSERSPNVSEDHDDDGDREHEQHEQREHEGADDDD